MSLQQCLKYIPQMPFELDKNGVSVCVELLNLSTLFRSKIDLWMLFCCSFFVHLWYGKDNWWWQIWEIKMWSAKWSSNEVFAQHFFGATWSIEEKYTNPQGQASMKGPKGLLKLKCSFPLNYPFSTWTTWTCDLIFNLTKVWNTIPHNSPTR